MKRILELSPIEAQDELAQTGDGAYHEYRVIVPDTSHLLTQEEALLIVQTMVGALRVGSASAKITAIKNARDTIRRPDGSSRLSLATGKYMVEALMELLPQAE